MSLEEHTIFVEFESTHVNPVHYGLFFVQLIGMPYIKATEITKLVPMIFSASLPYFYYIGYLRVV